MMATLPENITEMKSCISKTSLISDDVSDRSRNLIYVPVSTHSTIKRRCSNENNNA